MNAVPTAQAAKGLEVLIEKIIEDAEPTILLNDTGDKAVLMSLEEFNSWKETLYLLSNPANAEHLCRSLQEAEQGKVAEQELIDP
ncbi:MAG: antitoxin [Candidatus Electrothrix sp. AW2]|nr:antitoxin [Candidatus Electrothrix sp. AX1]MCI5134258.1 antitoxin [Candidatus Electrothrix gigas]MCI5182532.1 antitoxin [Candidatus Electrothrix gigas]